MEAGTVVAEVETSKAMLDVEAPEPGYLLRAAEEGDEISLDKPIAYVFPSSEALDEHAARMLEAARTAPASSNGVRATAPAIRRAAELGVDLASLKVQGLVTAKTVEAAASERARPPVPELPMPSPPRAGWSGSR